jgi:hypothetical protein
VKEEYTPAENTRNSMLAFPTDFKAPLSFTKLIPYDYRIKPAEEKKRPPLCSRFRRERC